MTKQEKLEVEMEENRRENDIRFAKVEENIIVMGKDIRLVREKIFNGMGTSIKSTEDKVDYIDQRNKEEHGVLRSDIKDLDKKLDKILWSLVGISFFMILAKVFEYVITLPTAGV